MRFVLEVCEKTKEAVGDSIAVGVRVSADEHRPGGFTYDDQKVLVEKLEELGMDFFHLSNGSYEELTHFFPEEDGADLGEARGFKETVGMPVITPSVHDPLLAEKAIREGMTDMILPGRQAVSDPEWANKAKAGDFQAINRCTKCMTCCVRICQALAVRCVVNPNVGREKYMPEYWRPTRPKRKKVVPQQLRKLPEEMPVAAH